MKFFEKKLSMLYEKMDNTYDKVSKHYGFKCKGCKDNCCYTLFFHHTHIEYHYLMTGFVKIDLNKQRSAEKNAEKVNEEINSIGNNKRLKQICPLNIDGLCIIYDYRPMICRLHGISHELQSPQGTIFSPGCEAFTKKAEEKKYFEFDRTIFYIEMAKLEKEFKNTYNIDKKFKKTVSQMILEKRDKLK
jgi:Fe-S-cluster containining protein